MSTEEFSNEFDVLVQSFTQNVKFVNTDSIAFTEYEKSVFLTKAQEQLVIELYNGKNPYNDTFEKTEEIRRYLNFLVKTVNLNPSQDDKLNNNKITNKSFMFSLPKDLLFITYESVDTTNTTCGNSLDVQVYPVTQDQFHRIKNNPFRGSKSRVLRLDAGNNAVELVSNNNITNYKIRYLSKPQPIIIQDLFNNLAIDGINVKTECKLHSSLHRLILERAVRMGLLSKSINIDTNQQ